MVLALTLKHRNPVTSKKKRFHIGVVVISYEAMPWSLLTLPPEQVSRQGICVGVEFSWFVYKFIIVSSQTSSPAVKTTHGVLDRVDPC